MKELRISRISKLEGKLVNLDTAIGKLQSEVKGIKQHASVLERKVDTSVATVKELEEDVADLSGVVDALTNICLQRYPPFSISTNLGMWN